MKKNKILSWVLSLVMALTIFSIPVAGVYADEEDTELCLAGVTYAGEDGDEDTYTPYGESIDFSNMILDVDYQYAIVALCEKYDSNWYSYSSDMQKLVFTNSNPGAVAIGYRDTATGKYVASSDATIMLLNGEEYAIDSYFYLIPQAAGETTLSVATYDSVESKVPTGTVTLKVQNVTQLDVDKAKFGQYLSDSYCEYFSNQADYDEQTIYGSVPSPAEYAEFLDNDDYFPEGPYRITEKDVKNMTISTTINGKEYTTHPDNGEDADWYEFELDVNNAAFGSYLTVTYKMGECTKTEKIIVSKWVNVKVTSKNYTYDGKSHTPSVTVKYGNTTLTKGKDYEVGADPRKTVGRQYIDIYNMRDCKYCFYAESFFQVNPKGTSITKLTKGKKAITVKWKKQAAKMSTSRINGYQIQLATNKGFTKNKKLVTVKGYGSVSKKVTKLKKKTKYFVRVRTYKTVNGVTCYSAWSAAKSVKTK